MKKVLLKSNISKRLFMFVFTKEIADFLRKIRERAGLSQKEAAERIGLSIKSFANISF
ncbi:MAG: helix-turn-helix domain-containing protein [candidate division WOR-3 bacterium]|nr:helix-turn-helix domain-containing protein [candidate division WOR-3 bacterium]